MAKLEQAKQSFERMVDEVTPSESRSLREVVQSIGETTSKIPPIGFMGLAVGSMVLSAALEVFSKRKEYGNFVGLWAPSFLMMGIYAKLSRLVPSEEARSHEKRAA